MLDRLLLSNSVWFSSFCIIISACSAQTEVLTSIDGGSEEPIYSDENQAGSGGTTSDGSQEVDGAKGNSGTGGTAHENPSDYDGGGGNEFPFDSSQGGAAGDSGPGIDNGNDVDGHTDDAEVIDSGEGGTGETGGSGGTAGYTGDGGGSINGVVLTAVITTLPTGAITIAGEWYNGSDETIYLRGCDPTDGHYLDENGEWQVYGQLAFCEATEIIPVDSGDTFTFGGGTPPDRGRNIWRLVGQFGVGCTPGNLLSEADCTQIFEVTSNQVTL